jgi:geranylgeranyl reductase family protein
LDKKKIRCFFKKAILQSMARYLKENYDVIICGAGPAGLYAANCLQKASADQISVLLLDKKSPWKEPVACAEAVSRKIFSRYWTPKEEWTRQHLDGVYFTSPDMTRVEYFQADCGLILNRAAFHHEMADKAAELGVECHFEDVVEKLFKAENGLWALKIRSGEGESELHAKVVIDATGPGAKITRHVPGLEALESGDFDQEAAVFAIAEGIPHSRRHIELLFGNRFFAGGYGWVFPRDGETVNVGLVGGRKFLKTHPPRSTLEKFIHEAYPDAKILAFHGGAIPCGQSEHPTAALGVFKAGDSASTVNPISRSGIVEAMKSGKIAAECALEWLSATTEEARREIEKSAYSRWMKIQGKTHLSYHRGKDGFASVSDEQFNKAAHRLASIPVHKRSIFRIFWAVLSSSPSILWKMKSFFI